MRAWWLLAASCASAPVAPAPPLSHRAEATCTIHDVELQDLPVHLALHGREFAITSYVIDRLDVDIAATQARARLESKLYALAGDLPLDTIAIRTTRPDLHDGWLVIGAAAIHRATGDHLELGVELPFGLEPRTIVVTKPCSELTFQPAPGLDEADRLIDFQSGTRTALRRAPGGDVLATIAPTGDTIYADVLEQRGTWVKIRLGRTNQVFGWVPVHVAVIPNLYGGLLGNENGLEPELLRCAHDAPIYFESTRVGTLRAHAEVVIGTRTPERIEINLGAAARPYVLAKDC